MSWFPCSKTGGGIKKGGILSSQNAAPGQSGYINFARITIKDNYADHTCYFGIQGRGWQFPLFLSVNFSGEDNNDPMLQSFYYWGNKVDRVVYISKKTTSTWDLWCSKGGDYDVIEILQMNIDYGHFDVTFPNEFSDTRGNGLSPTVAGNVAVANNLYDSSGKGGLITATYVKEGLGWDDIIWLACWNGYEIRAVNKNLFTYLKIIDHIYGMCVPYGDGSGVEDDIWIRTPKPGLLPYNTLGTSCLGYSDWPFGECHANMVFTNQIQARDNFQYNQGMYAHSFIRFYGSHIQLTSTVATNVGIDIQTQPASDSVRICPLATNGATLGDSSHLWRDIYANNATIQTSDRNKKKNISYIGQESDYEHTFMSDETLVKFVRSLRPCIFLMKDGESGRPHHGFISQDFKKTLDESGITDHAAYIKSPKTETVEKEVEQEREVYDEVEKKTKTVKETVKIQEEKVIPGEFIEGLRYEEVIPDITRFCQILYNQNQEQQKKIEDLKNRINILENIIKQGA